MHALVDTIRERVRTWREDGYQGVYPETKNILLHIYRRNYLYNPQREALEVYIYLKEVMNNRPISEVAHELFTDVRELLKLICSSAEEREEIAFAKNRDERIRAKAKEYFKDFGYPNYVLALTMGSGKTILMGALLMYDFIISFKHPEDERFAKNVLVFGPADTGIIEVLKEIKSFDYSVVVPKEYEDVLLNVKYWYLEKPETPLNPIGNFNVIVSNSSKIIIKDFKDTHKGNPLFELRRELANHRLQEIQRLENLAIFVDEAHHSYGKDLDAALNRSRETINYLATKTKVITVVNLTGTPYVKNKMMPDTVYFFGLKQGIEQGILKRVKLLNHGDVQSGDFVNTVVDEFVKHYAENRIEGRLPKIAFYAPSIEKLEDDLVTYLGRALRRHNIPVSRQLIHHSGLSTEDAKTAKYEFDRLDTSQSEKQFILLVGRGTEGWNCKSLVACALYRNPNSTNFVLQASCRCLRRIGTNETVARVFLSEDNYTVLDTELQNNFGLRISDLSDNEQKTMSVNLEVRKDKTILIRKQLEELVAVHNVAPEKIKVTFSLANIKALATIVKEREVTLEDGKAVYRDPVSVKSGKTVVHEREFGFYDIAAIVQRKTHLTFSEINKIFEVNNIDRDILVSEMQRNYLVADSIADQILEQFVKYEKKVFQIEQNVELTKAKTYTININDEHKKKLVVYREQEETEKGKSRIGFHIDPYNFDTMDELEIFRLLHSRLRKDELVDDVYFTGGITTDTFNEFYVEYYNPEKDNSIAKYFPDFLVETSHGRYFVIEIKGADEKHAYMTEKRRHASGEVRDVQNVVLAKELGFERFRELNKDFEYHLIFNGKAEENKEKLVNEISRFAKSK